MKKLLHIVFLDFDDIKNPLLGAGQAYSTYEVARRLIKEGHTVAIISSRYPGCVDRMDNGITYKHIGLGSTNVRLNNILYILTLPFMVRKLNADIIIECFTAPISTLCSPLFTKIPVVGKSTSFEADRFTKLYHIPFNIIEKYGSRLYNYFIASTSSASEKITALHPSIKSVVISEGVGNEYFSIKPEKSEYILFLGRLDINQKGIDILLKAYKRVAPSLKLPLFIAGHGPDKEKVEQMVKNLGLENKVRLLGPIYGEKKFSLLKHAAVVALPSRHEGFSLLTLEAFASGLPVVMFDIQGLEWVDKNIINQAHAFDTNMYADLLIKYIKEKKKRKKIAMYKSFAKKYTWDEVSKQYSSFLQEVVKNVEYKNKKNTFTVFDLIKAKLFAFIYKGKNRHISPVLPANYSLVKILKNAENGLAYTLGYYKSKKGKNVVIRQVPYTHQSLEYIQTYNEAKTLSLLHKFNTINVGTYSVKFPKLVNFQKTYNQLVLVREYFEGKSLSSIEKSKQVDILTACLSALEKVNLKLSISEKTSFSTRKSENQAYLLPLYLLMALLKNPSLAGLLIKDTITFYYFFLQTIIKPRAYVVTHRDLHDKNILVKGNNIHIIDSEIMAIAEKHTDLAYIARFWFTSLGVEELRKLIFQKAETTEEKKDFVRLSIFISIQLLAMVPQDNIEYKKTIKFLIFLQTTFIKDLLPNNDSFKQVIPMIKETKPRLDSYRPMVYNRKIVK